MNLEREETKDPKGMADELVIHIFKEEPVEVHTEEEVHLQLSESENEETINDEDLDKKSYNADEGESDVCRKNSSQTMISIADLKRDELAKNTCYEITLCDVRSENEGGTDASTAAGGSIGRSWRPVVNGGSEEFRDDSGCCEITLGDSADSEQKYDDRENIHLEDLERFWRNCLKRNVFGQGGEKVFTCGKCSFITKEKHDLKVHILSHFEIKRDETVKETPANSTQADDRFNISLVSSSNRKTFGCSRCDYEAVNLRDFMLHLRVHKNRLETRAYRCRRCHFETSDQKRIKEHFLTKHNKMKIHSCPRCPYKSNLKPALNRHLLTHNDSKLFRCSLCDFESNRKSYITLHMAKHNTGDAKLSNRESGYFKKSEVGLGNSSSSPKPDGEADSSRRPKDTDESERIRCPECDYVTAHVNNFKNHIISHNDYKLYDCSKCNYHIGRKSRLINHLLDHYNMKLLSCPKCSFRSNRSDNMNAHFVTHKDADVLKCDKCSFKAFGEEHLKKHSLKHNSYRCFQCEFETPRKTSLMEHMKLKHQNQGEEEEEESGVVKKDKKSFVCALCNYKTNFKRVLEAHLLNKHSLTKLYKCSKCSFDTNTKSTLKNHMLNHLDKKLYSCPDCDYSTNKKERLSAHSLKHTGFEFKCFDCDFGSDDKIEFETHLLQSNHNPNNEKLLSCSFCSFKSFRRNNLDVHLLEHYPAEEMRCPECHFSTNRRDLLKTHLLVHNDNKKFECVKCSYKIDRKSRLVNHLLSHYELKLIKCPLCKYKTNRTDGLNAHMLKHRDAKLFQCTECGFETNARSYLRKHLAEHILFKCTGCSYQTYSGEDFKFHCLEHDDDDKAKVQALIQGIKFSSSSKKASRKSSDKRNDSTKVLGIKKSVRFSGGKQGIEIERKVRSAVVANGSSSSSRELKSKKICLLGDQSSPMLKKNIKLITTESVREQLMKEEALDNSKVKSKTVTVIQGGYQPLRTAPTKDSLVFSVPCFRDKKVFSYDPEKRLLKTVFLGASDGVHPCPQETSKTQLLANAS